MGMRRCSIGHESDVAYRGKRRLWSPDEEFDGLLYLGLRDIRKRESLLLRARRAANMA